MAVGTINTGQFKRGSRVPLLFFDAETVVTSDSVVYAYPVSLFVFTAGTVVVTPFGGNSAANVTITVTAAMVANGPYQVPFMVKAVRATGTTATTMLGAW